MKKTVSRVGLMLCLLLVSSLMKGRILTRAESQVWIVDSQGRGDFTSIQEAIGNATSGDRIMVQRGTYLEHVIVDKSVVLIGADSNLTTIDGDGVGNVVFITASNVTVSGFTIRNSGPGGFNSGIYVYSSSGHNLSSNIIVGNNDGIATYSSNDDVISNNIVTSNSNDGIGLHSSKNSTVSSNAISGDNNGIVFYSSENSIVSNNTISHNANGVVLYSSSDNVFSGNTLSGDSFGVYLTFYSLNNIFYHNNFNNTLNAWADLTNVWDYAGEGNYWNNYEGQDVNGDGIGEPAYAINAYNQDNYPLLGMFSDFRIILRGKTYRFTTVSNSTISNAVFEVWAEVGDKITRFNTTGKSGTVGFCRIMIPNELMTYPYIVLIDSEETTPTVLDVSNATFTFLYLTYPNKNSTITIISSETLRLYNELIDEYTRLRADLHAVNETNRELLDNYTLLLQGYSSLQAGFDSLNASSQSIYALNATYYDLLSNDTLLLHNYTELQKEYMKLNMSYQDHLTDFNEQAQNLRNLMYMFAATTAIFIMTTIFFSKRSRRQVSEIDLSEEQITE